MFQDYAARGQLEPWQDAVSSVLFPVDTASAQPSDFSGRMRNWDFGDVSVAYMTSGPVAYRREQHHVAADEEEILLLSFATRSEFLYSQDGLDLVCRRNQCLVERSHRPSLFTQADAVNEMWVMRVPLRAIKPRLRAIDLIPALVIDAGQGAGGLLHDMTRLAPHRVANARDNVRGAIGRTLIDLLVVALEDQVRLFDHRQSSVRQAHLARIEAYIRRHLSDPALSAGGIAGACGISVRYLHDLFAEDGGPSLFQWIRERRLEAARAQLEEPARGDAIADIAYRWGFGDQAQFSRHFRRHFGVTPREHRTAARLRLARPA
ncbi:helix-turn-helix domain-containing protein [Zavarzinia sp.]|uniref:helix-turn-helix domain-containing protein n=1 Tax=Zavarzinia sp. TaxID=2027920 RepID=UPI003BB7DB68|nr:helix-turn-helix domain-containing protein [Zavarzinia sp.]